MGGVAGRGMHSTIPFPPVAARPKKRKKKKSIHFFFISLKTKVCFTEEEVAEICQAWRRREAGVEGSREGG